MINKASGIITRSCCRYTCLSLFINLITIIRENHLQLMRHLCAKLLNNKQQLLHMRREAPDKLVVVAGWLSEDSLSAAAECRWKTKPPRALCIRFSQQNTSKVISSWQQQQQHTRGGVSVQRELDLCSSSRWTSSAKVSSFGVWTDGKNSELW